MGDRAMKIAHSLFKLGNGLREKVLLMFKELKSQNLLMQTISV